MPGKQSYKPNCFSFQPFTSSKTRCSTLWNKEKPLLVSLLWISVQKIWNIRTCLWFYTTKFWSDNYAAILSVLLLRERHCCVWKLEEDTKISTYRTPVFYEVETWSDVLGDRNNNALPPHFYQEMVIWKWVYFFKLLS